MWILWRWSNKNQVWTLESSIVDEGRMIGGKLKYTLRNTAMRNAKRRNPGGTLFKWRLDVEGPPRKKPFKRAVQM